MELTNIIFLSVSAVLLITIGIFYFLKKDYLKWSKIIKPILSAGLSVLKAVGNIFPNNHTLSTMITVVSVAIKAAGNAEELWLQGKIDKEKRPEYAKEYIVNALTEADIAITDAIITIIDGIIALTCYIMPHYGDKDEEEEG